MLLSCSSSLSGANGLSAGSAATPGVVNDILVDDILPVEVLVFVWVLIVMAIAMWSGDRWLWRTASLALGINSFSRLDGFEQGLAGFPVEPCWVLARLHCSLNALSAGIGVLAVALDVAILDVAAEGTVGGEVVPAQISSGYSHASFGSFLPNRFFLLKAFTKLLILSGVRSERGLYIVRIVI